MNVKKININQSEQTYDIVTSALDAGYLYAGIATPDTNPGIPDVPVFYIAGEGTYTNFSEISVDKGELAVLTWNGTWSKQSLKVGLPPNELNISYLFPTNGEGGTNQYTLAGAIAQVPAEYRVQGLKVTFTNENEETETWSFDGGDWVKDNFSEIDAKTISDLSDEIGTWKTEEFINTPNVPLDSVANFNGWQLVLDGTKYADTISLAVREAGKFQLRKLNKTTKVITDLEEITTTEKGIKTFKLSQTYKLEEDEVFVLKNTTKAPVQYYATDEYVMPTIDDSGTIYNNQKGVPLVHLTYRTNISNEVVSIKKEVVDIKDNLNTQIARVDGNIQEIEKLQEGKANKEDIIINFINSPNISLESKKDILYQSPVIEGTKYADTISLNAWNHAQFKLMKLNKKTKEFTDLETFSIDRAGIKTFKLKQLYVINDDEVFVVKNTSEYAFSRYATDEHIIPTFSDDGTIYYNQKGILLVHLTAAVPQYEVLDNKIEDQNKKLAEISEIREYTHAATEEAINRAINSIWYDKTVGYVGDSYADASSNIFSQNGKMYHPTYPEIFAKTNNKCNVIDKTLSGAVITNGYIYRSALQIVKDYGDKFSELLYPIATTENTGHSEIGGKVHLPNCNKLDYILVNVFPNSSNQKTNDWLNMRLWSYDTSTGEYQELGKYSYMHEMPNSEAWDWAYCVGMFYFDTPIEIDEGKEFAISFTLGQRSEDTVNAAITIVNDSNTYICNGTTKNGYPLIRYGLRSQLDYMVFEGGLNDTGKEIGAISDSYDLDQEFNLNTYYGSLEAMIVAFRRKSQTTKLGWVILPGDWQTPNKNQPILDVCKKWAVNVLNLEDRWRGMTQGLNKQYSRTPENSNWVIYNPYYFIKYDGGQNSHPSPMFYQLFNDTIFEWMKTL